jgi:pimeloyl-ACP methyl ester carboxylesterase
LFYPYWAYLYTIDVSENGTNFTTVVDQTDNTTPYETTDTFSAQGRYVRITIVAGNPDGAAMAREFKVYAGDSPISISTTDAEGQPVEALALNGDGWPTVNAANGAAANPITVTVTVTNTSTLPTIYNPKVSFGSPENKARFYIFSTPPELLCPSPEEAFSYTSYPADCGTGVLQPGASIALHWNVWVQPSLASTLVVSASLLLDDGETVLAQAQDSLEVPEASIHQVVFIHGILGSMPPRNTLVVGDEQAREVFDPFLGSYWPLLDQLEKIGYEWNKTLFGMAYDWRQPNDRSAVFLASYLNSIGTIGFNTPYVAHDGEGADLIAHSMGGLVSRAYIQGEEYQDDVRKVIFIATPHKGFPFDYQTWEGLTWRDYLYNAPWYSGGLLDTISKFMDTTIWPKLVKKKFVPCDAELAQDCRPFEGDIYSAFVIEVDSQGGGHDCSKNAIAKWAHVINPNTSDLWENRGVRSLFEMLPTDDLLPPQGLPGHYLVRNETTETSPFGYQPNTFLHDLNSRIDVLAMVLQLTRPIATVYPTSPFSLE